MTQPLGARKRRLIWSEGESDYIYRVKYVNTSMTAQTLGKGEI